MGPGQFEQYECIHCIEFDFKKPKNLILVYLSDMEKVVLHFFFFQKNASLSFCIESKSDKKCQKISGSIFLKGCNYKKVLKFEDVCLNNSPRLKNTKKFILPYIHISAILLDQHFVYLHTTFIPFVILFIAHRKESIRYWKVYIRTSDTREFTWHTCI